MRQIRGAKGEAVWHNIFAKPRSLFERKDKLVSSLGKNIRKELQFHCRWAKAPPSDKKRKSFILGFYYVFFEEDNDDAG